MPAGDGHDLEQSLREQRPIARDEFVSAVAAGVRDWRTASKRPLRRVTFATVLSLTLLVSLLAFGGIGAASSALQSSSSMLRAAVGKDPKKSRHGKGDDSAAKSQYHQKVGICYPKIRYIVTYKYVTKYKWVWEWQTQKHHGHKVRVKVPVLVKIRVHVKVTSYIPKTVSASRVPSLVAKGAIYPVPAGGCSSLNGGGSTA